MPTCKLGHSQIVALFAELCEDLPAAPAEEIAAHDGADMEGSGEGEDGEADGHSASVVMKQRMKRVDLSLERAGSVKYDESRAKSNEEKRQSNKQLDQYCVLSSVERRPGAAAGAGRARNRHRVCVPSARRQAQLVAAKCKLAASG